LIEPIRYSLSIGVSIGCSCLDVIFRETKRPLNSHSFIHSFVVTNKILMKIIIMSDIQILIKMYCMCKTVTILLMWDNIVLKLWCSSACVVVARRLPDNRKVSGSNSTKIYTFQQSWYNLHDFDAHQNGCLCTFIHLFIHSFIHSFSIQSFMYVCVLVCIFVCLYPCMRAPITKLRTQDSIVAKMKIAGALLVSQGLTKCWSSTVYFRLGCY